jgi:hypothetical protein
VPAVVAVQEPAAIAGLSDVFPQGRYPFPRDFIAARWRDEVADPEVECFVLEAAGRIAGFAALPDGRGAARHRPPHAELLAYELVT